MIRPIGKSKIKQSQTKGTILDRDNCRRITIDIEKVIPGGVAVGEGTRVCKARLPKGLRTHLVSDNQGNLVLTPVLRAFDRLLEAVLSGNGARVRQATIDFFRARCREMQQEFVKVAKPRNERSAMLIGVCGYRGDIFCGDNYLNGRLSDLKPWQMGLNARTLAKLEIKPGDLVILSRYPTTMVLPIEAVEMDVPGNVVSLPAYNCLIEDQVTSAAHETGGDLDGDSYTVRSVHSEKAVAELRTAFQKFWRGVTEVELDRTVHTWEDHEPRPTDPWQVARQKIMQKTSIGSLTLDWYAGFQSLLDAKTCGKKTDLSFEDMRKLMMQSLESVFDLKHSNGASPMVLHALLLGMVSFDQAKQSLEMQGFDTEKIAQVVELIDHGNVRNAASANLAFAITCGHTEPGFNPVERFAKRVPEDKSLAEAFRDELFPLGYGTSIGEEESDGQH